MNLVFQILVALAGDPSPRDSSLLHIAGYRPERIAEHVRLLDEAGLVQGVRVYSIEYRLRWLDLDLTPRGRDFLAAARAGNECPDTAPPDAPPLVYVGEVRGGGEFVPRGAAA